MVIFSEGVYASFDVVPEVFVVLNVIVSLVGLIVEPLQVILV